MSIQELFNTFPAGFVAERVSHFWGDQELRVRLIELADEICCAVPVNNGWVLERKNSSLRVKDVPDFQECFKMMSAEEIAGLDCSGIHPAKLRDAMEILEEYSFFRL